MKKKLLICTFFMLLVALSATFLSACTDDIFHSHVYGAGEITPPTCTEYGYTTYTCECGKKLRKNYIYARGHLFNNYIANDDADCENNATETAFCTNGCGEADTREIENTALGHSFTYYTPNNDAACGKNATETAHCDNDCGKTHTREIENTLLYHSFTNYIPNNDAACEKNATETATCDNGCGKTHDREIRNTALEHSFTNYIPNNDAACEKNATETAFCDNNCGNTHTRTIENSALGHNFIIYESVGAAATCTTNRFDTYRCEFCEKTEDKEIADTALGHSYTKYVSNGNATCTADGTETATCDNGCKNTDTRTDENSALGHDFTKYICERSSATCTANQFIIYQCSRCIETEDKEIIGTKTGHSFTNYTYNDDATYESDGTKTATCDNGCGESHSIPVEGTMKESYAEFTTLTVNDTNVTGKVRYANAEFNFNDEINIYGVVTFVVCDSFSGGNTYENKVVPLTEGENTFIVTVMNGNAIVKQYNVSIYRNHLYTVSFDTAGGSATDDQKVEEGYLVTQPDVTKLGYTLTAWDYDFDTPITGDILITAEWIITEYTITYNLGMDEIETETYTIETETFELYEPSRNGATFLWWIAYDADNNYYKPTRVEKGTTGDLVFYASWEYEVYNITLVYLDGVIGTATYETRYGYELPYADYRVNPGYIFEWWYDNPDYSGSSIRKIKMGATGDKTFYAKWKTQNYTITYDYNRFGTAIEGSDYTIKTESNGSTYPWVMYNGELRPDNFHIDDSSAIYTITVKNELTLSFSYKVSSETSQDKFIVSKNGRVLFRESGQQSTYTDYSLTLSPGDVITFEYSKNGIDYRGSDTVFIKNLTYSVSNKTTTETYTIEDTPLTLMTPTLNGYTFEGWYTSRDSGTKVTQLEQGTYGNITLYAKWKLN